jgi:hypothetical protein
MTSVKKTLERFKKNGLGTPEQRAARLAATGGNDVVDNPKIVSSRDLKNLTKEDLIARLHSIDNQYTILKWRIWWAIRQKFKSDKLFGQYINELRQNPEYLAFVGSQQEINRMAHAGRFCEKWKITDLNEAKIPRTAIYELSRPTNEDISDAVYKEVKSSVRRRIPLDEVDRLIARAKAVHTIENQSELERMDYDKPEGKRFIEVQDGIAQTSEVLEQLGEDIEPAIEHHEVVKPVTVPSMPEPMPKAQAFEYARRFEEPIEQAAGLSDEQIAKEVMDFMRQFQLSPNRLISVLQVCIGLCRDIMYPKRQG